jgi:hypothetical protein
MADLSAGRIFISYRREETAYAAGWLFNRLADTYGNDQIFKDVDSIELGDDFVEVISRAVGSTDVLLALIGDTWITITDGRGNRRLDDPDDFVRLEIEAALTRRIRVIPILVDGATMPRDDELPPSLAGLARRQALELSPSRFEYDTTRLLKVLDKTLAEVREETLAGGLQIKHHTDRDQRTAPPASDEPGSTTEQPTRTAPSIDSARTQSKREDRTQTVLSSRNGWRERLVTHWRVLAGIGVASLVALVAIVFLATRSDSPSTAQGATIFEDSLSTPTDSRWSVDSSAAGTEGTGFSNGAFQVSLTREASRAYVLASARAAPSDENVRVKVDARHVGGTAKAGYGYGLFCRSDGAGDLYLFTLWAKNAVITKQSGGQAQDIDVNSDFTAQGEEVKELQAVCTTIDGGRAVDLQFLVNGQPVLSKPDPSEPLKTGAFGLHAVLPKPKSAGGKIDDTLEVEFNNFKVVAE